MKLNMHKKIAICWLFVAPFLFFPFIVSTNNHNAGTIIIMGIILVAGIILHVPILLKFDILNRLFNWTDALSARQKEYLKNGKIMEFYIVGYHDDYIHRIFPYLLNLTILLGVQAIISTLIRPTSSNILTAISFFMGIYTMAVIFLIGLSIPWFSLKKSS